MKETITSKSSFEPIWFLSASACLLSQRGAEEI